MLDTLIQLGQQISKNRNPWDDIIHIPNLKDAKNNYVLNIIFDVDQGNIDIDPANLEEFDSSSPYRHTLMETLKGNAKKIYPAVLFDKINHLKESLFGKQNARKGQLMEDVNAIDSSLEDSLLYQALQMIFSLKSLEYFLTKDHIKSTLALSRKSEIVFCYASVKSSRINQGTPIELSKLDGFEAYINKKFFDSKHRSDSQKKRLDYALGEVASHIMEAKFQRGYNLNAMFVTTTSNFANDFKNHNYHKNYQLSENTIKYLDRASKYLLKNLSFTIAGIKHMIVPEFLSISNVDYESAIDTIFRKNDLLFNLKGFDELTTSMMDEAEIHPYWLNYIAIDSDGNYFKASNLIKDVSQPYLIKVMKVIDEINDELEAFLGKYIFNFYTLYRYIPVRDNVKRNIALELYGDLFQQRPLEKKHVFKAFNQYIRCQRSGQFSQGKHNSYPNT